MLYYRCPTCKTKLANRQLLYEEGMRKICNNPNLSAKEINDKKIKLVNEMEVLFCCKPRLITYVDLISLIK